MKTRDIIYQSIKIRLSCTIPYMSRWNEAMAVGAMPSNAKNTFDTFWKLADEVWVLAGDRSDSPENYRKRLMFLSIYGATEIFMITDKSKDFFETWEFLDRRIDDALKLGV